MTTLDYRWNAAAQGWAYHAAKNETMAEFLAVAERIGKARPEPSRAFFRFRLGSILLKNSDFSRSRRT